MVHALTSLEELQMSWRSVWAVKTGSTCIKQRQELSALDCVSTGVLQPVSLELMRCASARVAEERLEHHLCRCRMTASWVVAPIGSAQSITG